MHANRETELLIVLRAGYPFRPRTQGLARITRLTGRFDGEIVLMAARPWLYICLQGLSGEVSQCEQGDASEDVVGPKNCYHQTKGQLR